MGRITPSIRQRIQKTIRSLKRHYRAAFKADEMQEAFDALIPAWSRDMGAMIFLSSKQPVSALDLLVLNASVDNRREIETLRRELEELNETMKQAIST